MENIFLHIERLLAYHDYVIVPGLGGFVVQNQSAAVFHERVMPPLATVGFNALMHHADGLLALETARAEGITYRQAVEKVQHEVEKVKQQFSETDFFKFGNIGFFKRTTENALLFTPTVNIEFLPINNFGANIYVSKKTVAVLKPAKHFSMASILRYAAAGALLLGLSISAPNRNDAPDFQTANLLSFELPRLSKPETLSVIPVTDTVAALTETPASAETEAEIPLIGNPDSYEVIVACLSTVQAAEKYCNALKNSNFANAHIFSGSRLYMVSLQNFQTRNDAVEYMNEIRMADSKFEQAWVFCKQNTN
jgi:hypothetical protein